jgi:hypothetical protein
MTPKKMSSALAIDVLFFGYNQAPIKTVWLHVFCAIEAAGIGALDFKMMPYTSVSPVIF